MSTTFGGQFVQTLGQLYGIDNVIPLVYLNGAILTAAATTFPTLSVPAYNTLAIAINAPAFGGADNVSLRFNADAGNNYQFRTLSLASASITPIVDNPGLTTSSIVLGPAALAVGRTIYAFVSNTLASPKVLTATVGLAGAAVGTSPVSVISCQGTWFNTTAQITTVTCLTAGGQTIAAGSSIQIFGGL